MSSRKVAFENEDDVEEEEFLNEGEDDDVLEDSEEEDEGDEMDFELEAMDETLAAYLTTDDGDNVATALMSINDNIENLVKSIELQNKILIKVATHLCSEKKNN